MNFRKLTLRALDGWRLFFAAVLFCAAAGIASSAQTFTTVVTFNGTDGSGAYAAPVQGFDGNFYATTKGGGSDTNGYCPFSLTGCGTVYEMTPGGALTTLYSFCNTNAECTDGWSVDAGLVQASDGNFYGTAFAGGAGAAGTVFKMTTAGALTTLHSFDLSDGAGPGNLVKGLDGNFYGVTRTFGANNGYGTVFKMTRAGTLTTLHTFDTTDGSQPNSVVQGNDGNLYGTTLAGGNLSCYLVDPPGCGTVFKLTPAGTLTTLYTFCPQANCADGSSPGNLVQGADGNFYGTTVNGGNSACDSDGFIGCGTVFKITAAGAFTSLFSFCHQANCATKGSLDGAFPYALLQANDGNFYGVTQFGGNLKCDAGGCGTIFELTAAGTLKTLYAFQGTADGIEPKDLMQATDGTFYGTTITGGSGYGTAFNLSLGLAPFVALSLDAGRVGQNGGILGQGFTGTTGVFLNGTPATFTVVSDTYIRATVPAGATSGYVTVDTPSGTITSNVAFRVIP
jgi:uncharacterized repeat protein (TIGR03803 family)